MLGVVAMAQDVIVLRDGDVIQSKVLEVGEDGVKYKKWSNVDGPTYSMSIANILAINYQNGTKDNFANYSVAKSDVAQSIDTAGNKVSDSITTAGNNVSEGIDRSVNLEREKLRQSGEALQTIGGIVVGVCAVGGIVVGAVTGVPLICGAGVIVGFVVAMPFSIAGGAKIKAARGIS